MARIVFSVMGDALGHVNQALALVEEMPQHEFLFLGDGKVRQLKAIGYSVEQVPMMGTFYSNNRVDVAATASNALSVLCRSRSIIDRVKGIMRAFDPVIVLTAFEFYAPIVARKLGIPSVTIDNQHILTKCIFAPPRSQSLSRLMFELPLRLMYSHTDKYLINAFFQPPPKDPGTVRVCPPLLKRSVLNVTPSEADHALVYQTSPTFQHLFDVLEQMPGRFLIYGLGSRPPRKNLIFKEPSTEGFLEDLASCRYVITNGGHNVIAEALYLGKPVLSFPIQWAYEQFINAHTLSALGYGEYCLESVPDLDMLKRFEGLLDMYRSRTDSADFYGNQIVAAELEGIIEDL